MPHSYLRRFSVCAFLATTALYKPSLAWADAPAPKSITLDRFGVDLTSGLPWLQIEEGGIGSGSGRVSMQRIWAEGAKWTDNWTGGMFDVTSGLTTKTYVQIGGTSEVFTKSGTTFTADEANGATLVPLANGDFLYTEADGTTIEFDANATGEAAFYCPGSNAPTCHAPIAITRPNGVKFTLSWHLATMCVHRIGPDCSSEWLYRRLTSVSSSAGYSLAVHYLVDAPGTGTSPAPGWYDRSSVTFSNSANPPPTAPTITYSYPAGFTTDITDPGGRTWEFITDTSGILTSVRRPGSSSANISYAYGTDGTVSSVTQDGVTESYWRVVSGNSATETTYDALGKQTITTADLTITQPTSFQDELGRVTSFTYDPNGRLTQATQPEGNYVQYAYDGRGNVTSTTTVSKSGSGLPNVVTSASFDSNCAIAVKCNQPNSTTDAKGNVTSYTYDPIHGGVTAITRPAPITGAVPPQARFIYTQLTSASGDLVYQLTSTSDCQAGSAPSCLGTSDETKATIAYNSSLLPTSVTRSDGTGALSVTATSTYDSHGNLNTVVGPLVGETTTYRYDSADQVIGITSPDPDGPGPLTPRATRLTYRPDGQVVKQELGTVTDPSDTAWANFSTAQEVDTGFDSNNRPNTQLLVSGGTTYALTHRSYDALGRPDCTAIRMNPSTWSSLPSACTPVTAGAYGPDQISKLIYDAAGQLTQVQIGIGTSGAVNERTLTYSNNGQVTSLTDGENNKTTYVYDGFDRLSQTQYPIPTKGAGTSNASDYEQLTYDPNGNISQKRLRNGATISYGYDALDRTTSKGGAATSVNYTYDNLGRMLTATFASGGQGITNIYDALGRLTSSSSNMDGTPRTMSSQYDAAGNRTMLTGNIANYSAPFSYDLLGRMTAYVGVVQFGYDSLGRRISMSMGSSGTTSSASYGYDSISRLTSLTHNLAGTTANQSLTFSYSPASQISVRTGSNDSYAYTGFVNVNRGYANNGLNQYTAAGSASFAYDANGNLTSDGSNTFTYDPENRLTSASGAHSATLSYDPLGRLWQISAPSGTTRFIYDGDHDVIETDGFGNVLRAFTWGPGADEPLVWWEGAGPRMLHADERGSIISVADNNGNSIATNTYDEYGTPGSANQGRFQYTGQVWLSEIGLYYYKNRMYSPTLGRFLQTDPIGYGDGPNWYAYTHSDPVNGADPLGLEEDPIIVTGSLFPLASLSASVGFGAVGGLSSTAGTPHNPPPASPPQTPAAQCAKGLKDAKKDMAAVNRAKTAWDILKQAAAKTDLGPAFLAAEGVQESGFVDKDQNRNHPNDAGRGVFQIDGSQNPQVSYAQAHNLTTAAGWAAKYFSHSESLYRRAYPSFTPSQLLEATALSYNEGQAGFPKWYGGGGFPNAERHSGDAHKSYGQNVVNLMSCFAGMR